MCSIERVVGSGLFTKVADFASFEQVVTEAIRIVAAEHLLPVLRRRQVCSNSIWRTTFARHAVMTLVLAMAISAVRWAKEC